MTQFRKKPVVISAEQYDGSDECGNRIAASSEGRVVAMRGALIIQTPEGSMKADPGDWIITGIKGELYPCKPDIFAATYEAVDG